MSIMKLNRVVLILGGVAIFLLILGAIVYSRRMTDSLPTGGQAQLPLSWVSVGSTTIEAELATTPEQQQAGLSNRTGLAEGRGMLFIFNPPRMLGFWMKDMKFSLDMIWTGDDGVVMTINRNISPATYPNVFYPAEPAHYVLEVPAGFADQHRVAIGDKIVVQ